MNSICIGPSGNSQIFYDAGFKKSIDAPKFLKNIGLNAYEYSFGRGFTMGADKAIKLGEEGVKNNVKISLHAPYYINFANPSDEMIQKSIEYVKNSIKYLQYFQGEKIVVHTASTGKVSREQAILRVKQTLTECIKQIKENFDMTGKYICLETMGKYQQIGTYQEIIDLCCMDDIFLPAFDFGHINCVLQGGLKTEEDYEKVFNYSFEKLGEFKTKNCHIHFSKIEYGAKGEIKHLDFTDTVYGPEFEPLAKVIKKLNLTPSIICESKDKMMEDALTIKQIFDKV